MEKCFICLGSNLDGENQILKAEKSLNESFKGIRWGKTIITPAEGTEQTASYYHNKGAILYTSRSIEELKQKFKSIEIELGRTPSSKSSGIIPIDIDLISYGPTIVKPADLEKEYIKRVLSVL